MLDSMLHALGQPRALASRVHVDGYGDLPSVFPVSDLAVASVSAAALAVASLLARRHAQAPAVRVDRARASYWFSQSLHPIGWQLPPAWDAFAGDYRTADGWIRLHTNAPAHRAAALRALEIRADSPLADRDGIAEVLRGLRASELEARVVAEGGCAAQMHTAQEWAAHPQGRAVAQEPLIALMPATAGGRPPRWLLEQACPLRGVRVLDLTRILAGPVATRFLAGHGADVLRIDPPGWDEPALAPEVTLGKRRARLDLRSARGMAVFERLLAGADVLVHGYRSDALETLGIGAARRRALNPRLVDVALDAYGWTGPWASRRGFDSLVQMSSGIAAAGMRLRGSDRPVPLPVQALDHAAGYLLAAAAVTGLAHVVDHGRGSDVRISLARTARLLTDASTPCDTQGVPLPGPAPDDFSATLESTPWGSARRLRAPYAIDGSPVHWDRPAGRLGDSAPSW